MLRRHDDDKLCGGLSLSKSKRLGVWGCIMGLQLAFVICVLVMLFGGNKMGSNSASGEHSPMTLAAVAPQSSPSAPAEPQQISLHIENLHVHPASISGLTMAPTLPSGVAARLESLGLPVSGGQQQQQQERSEPAAPSSSEEETDKSEGAEELPATPAPSSSPSDSAAPSTAVAPPASSFSVSVTDRYGTALTCDESELAQPVHKFRIWHKVPRPFLMYAHDPATDAAISGAFALGWLYEYAEHTQLESRLRAVDHNALASTPVLYVDVGTNIGNHLIPLALAGVAHEYHGFEASVHNWRLLTCSGVMHREEMNGNPVVLNNLAISDEMGTPPLCMLSDPTNQGHTFVRGMDPYIEQLRIAAGNDPAKLKALQQDKSEAARLALSNDEQCRWVHTITLDEYWSTTLGGRRVGLMKVDIEGYEGKAMAGAKRMMATSPPFYLMLEVLPKHMKRSGSDPAQLLVDIFQYGYSLDPSSDKQAPHGRIDSMTYEQAKDMLDNEKLPPNLWFTHKDAKKLEL